MKSDELAVRPPDSKPVMCHWKKTDEEFRCNQPDPDSFAHRSAARRIHSRI